MNMIKGWALLILFFSLHISARAQIKITNSLQKEALGEYALKLDPGREASIDEISRSKSFVATQQSNPNLGLVEHSVWMKFSVQNQSAYNKLLLEIAYPILDEVELFAPDGKGGFTRTLLGEIKKFKDRKYKYPQYIFDLNVEQGITKTYFLRVKSSEQIILPIFITHPSAFWQELNVDNLIIGIFVGIVLIMLLYNLFVYFSVGDRSYLYYVVYVFFVGLTQTGIKGYTFQFLWPNAPDFQLRSVVLTSCISVIAALLFTRNFLQTKLYARKADYFCVALIGLFTIGIILTLSGFVQKGFVVMQGATSLSALLILVISIIIMAKGYVPARFFFAAWSVLLAGAVIFLLKDVGILPYNTFTSYSMQGASAIEMALLSFGLADRINILKREKEASQAEALAVAKENERIIREQNVVLEEKVKERTVELEASNEGLSTALSDLQQAQIQLVESEKMASLGQLTAGIAHEINNPINFVTSNVAPLQRDVNILMDAISAMENLSFEDGSAEEKQKKIDEYKEEIDYDYLKMEISHLLKGINEGASRTAEIVKGLRVFSRLDEDDLKIADVTEGLESTMVIANNLLNNIKVTREYSDLPAIECYPGKLNQVFLNIIANAVHAIRKRHGEGTEGELTVKTSCNEQSLFVKIADNGTGMSDATVKKIFEPFFTTKDVGEGTGLGMSIAYNTIKKHDGQIHVNSVLGEGTEFIIELPIGNKKSET